MDAAYSRDSVYSPARGQGDEDKRDNHQTKVSGQYASNLRKINLLLFYIK